MNPDMRFRENYYGLKMVKYKDAGSGPTHLWKLYIEAVIESKPEIPPCKEENRVTTVTGYWVNDRQLG